MIEQLTTEYDLARSLTVGLILFVSTIVVRVAGFGGSLTSMPLLTPIIGLNVASPLMNLFGVTNFSTIVIQKWREVQFSDIWRLVITNIIFTPAGIWLLSLTDESFLRLVLGIVCAGYSAMRLLKLPPPTLENPNWGWVYGFFSGIFTGAFSVGGVPAVLYADTQSWEPERFRINMFSFFTVTGFVNLATRYFAGQITLYLILLWLTAIPFLIAGLWVGGRLIGYIDKNRFQQLVLIMLVVLGLRLIYSGIG